MRPTPATAIVSSLRATIVAGCAAIALTAPAAGQTQRSTAPRTTSETSNRCGDGFKRYVIDKRTDPQSLGERLGVRVDILRALNPTMPSTLPLGLVICLPANASDSRSGETQAQPATTHGDAEPSSTVTSPPSTASAPNRGASTTPASGTRTGSSQPRPGPAPTTTTADDDGSQPFLTILVALLGGLGTGLLIARVAPGHLASLSRWTRQGPQRSDSRQSRQEPPLLASSQRSTSAVQLLVRPVTGEYTQGIALTRLDPFGYVQLSEHLAVLAEATSDGLIERGQTVAIVNPTDPVAHAAPLTE